MRWWWPPWLPGDQPAEPAAPPQPGITQERARADAAEREVIRIREQVVELDRDLGNERAVGDAKERELGVYRGKLARIRTILDE